MIEDTFQHKDYKIRMHLNKIAAYSFMDAHIENLNLAGITPPDSNKAKEAIDEAYEYIMKLLFREIHKE